MNVCELDREYYYINDPIGYGSFSVVFKGYRYEDSKPIAVKLITKIIDRRYFENEIRIMRQINHPNILDLYKVIRKEGKVYLILEYCNGGDLSNYIQQNETSFDNRYFYQILDGLEHLYDNKILHRDIKPQNIFIHNDKPILVDWEPCTLQQINSKKIIKSHSRGIAIKDRKIKKISPLTDKKGFLKLISEKAFSELADTSEMKNLTCRELLDYQSSSLSSL